MANIDELVQAVKAHALAHYEEGWDVVVEAYEDQEIAEVIGKARTVKGAIARFNTIVSIWNDRVADAANSAF